ncbi:uncharacterized protein YpmS [Salirhabdus euzebyi]|uniref:Uncharacterized protein YpmS n=1 Tax=Salirhabdus euzebyi TaxID=394506 RepID=A0A841Q5Z3_9BACI|nr:YpmS family protein [Salirhabdus euzebyi]MBB6453811.1 uncharacterized protein YpmS [Salirhabdus euzebyi]
MFEKIKIKNKWKALFFGLMGINAVVIIWLLLLIFLPLAGEKIESKENIDKGQAEFTISSTKQNLNRLINTYLEELSEHTDIDYAISIDDSVKLIGTILAFEKDIPLTASFTPEVQENGDLNLKLQSITLGRLELPNKKVLDYVKKNYPMPEWVIVNPGDESIYAAVTEMKIRSNFNVAVESFNLKRNRLSFKLTVPNKAFHFNYPF